MECFLFMSKININQIATNPVSRLEDLSPMPYGKYKGVLMQDIPTEYLHYLWCYGLEHNQHSTVAEYIKRNLEALKMENDDLIW